MFMIFLNEECTSNVKELMRFLYGDTFKDICGKFV